MLTVRHPRFIEFIFRIGICFTFVGHGYYALNGKQEWIPLVQAFGFSEETAQFILPIVGVMDIIVGVSILLKPVKAVIIWAAFWAFIAALSRPLSGMDLLEMIERSSNWALPLVFLIYLSQKNKSSTRKGKLSFRTSS